MNNEVLEKIEEYNNSEMHSFPHRRCGTSTKME